VSWHASSASSRFGRKREHSRSASGRVAAKSAFKAAESPSDAARASASTSALPNSTTAVFCMYSACGLRATLAVQPCATFSILDFRRQIPTISGDPALHYREQFRSGARPKSAADLIRNRPPVCDLPQLRQRGVDRQCCNRRVNGREPPVGPDGRPRRGIDMRHTCQVPFPYRDVLPRGVADKFVEIEVQSGEKAAVLRRIDVVGQVPATKSARACMPRSCSLVMMTFSEWSFDYISARWGAPGPVSIHACGRS
jgi:hypothetical protein